MQRILYSILGNSQKLDGGAMFGNAPKLLWERWVDADERNRIDLACRALLVREPTRTILFEAGVGAFFDPKMKDRFGIVESNHVLLDNLNALNFKDEDIDVVVLSHLHFDHAGGLLSAWEKGKEPSLLFPKARFVVGKEAWERANNPHPRDKASFIPELNKLLAESGRLEIVSGNKSVCLGKGYTFHRSNGHTPGMLLTEIQGQLGPILFAADLIPGRAWVHRSITMGYDRFPEQLIDEKTKLLDDLVSRGGRLFFTHDSACAMARVTKDEKNRFGSTQLQTELSGVVA
jgi:glyoxylase-like metal-dependent hydrolase (beta-lactamase superfamily II)